jgi:hypothetical protein
LIPGGIDRGFGQANFRRREYCGLRLRELPEALAARTSGFREQSSKLPQDRHIVLYFMGIRLRSATTSSSAWNRAYNSPRRFRLEANLNRVSGASSQPRLQLTNCRMPSMALRDHRSGWADCSAAIAGSIVVARIGIMSPDCSSPTIRILSLTTTWLPSMPVFLDLSDTVFWAHFANTAFPSVLETVSDSVGVGHT